MTKKVMISIEFGVLDERNPNYGVAAECYVCGKPHLALHVAIIRERRRTTAMPLCDVCCVTGDDAIARKYLASPDLKIEDRGKVTTEQLAALADKQDESEH